jgi:hypothetical protein
MRNGQHHIPPNGTLCRTAFVLRWRRKVERSGSGGATGGGEALSALTRRAGEEIWFSGSEM